MAGVSAPIYWAIRKRKFQDGGLDIKSDYVFLLGLHKFLGSVYRALLQFFQLLASFKFQIFVDFADLKELTH